jgi:hypothetical protein
MSLPATIIRSAICVDDDDDIGQFVERDLLGLVDRFAGLFVKTGLDCACQRLAFGGGFGDASVEAVDVAHADLRHLLVAILHLPHAHLSATTAFFGSVTTGVRRCGMPS